MPETNPFEDHWYYQDGSHVRGPFRKEAMIVAIMDGDLVAEIYVWNTSWEDSAPKRALKETELGGYLTDEAREKYAPKAVSDVLAWVLGLLPIALMFIDSALIYDYNPIVFSNGYLFAVPLVYSAIALVDALAIRDSGRSRAPLYWFWVIPVYLIIRALKLKRGIRFFWMWLISSLLYASVVFGLVDGGYFMPSSRPLPACANTMVIDTNKQLFDDAMRENSPSYSDMARSIHNALGADYGTPYGYSGHSPLRQSPRARDIINIEQVAVTSEIRSCQADVLASHGPRVPIDYSIRRSEGGIEVELRSR